MNPINQNKHILIFFLMIKEYVWVRGHDYFCNYLTVNFKLIKINNKMNLLNSKQQL